MGDVEFYIKQLEDENEKLRASLESALFDKEIEEKRNIFVYEKWVTDQDGTIRLSESTLDKHELRKWIDYKASDLVGYENFILVFTCTAYKKDRNALVARYVWDVDYEHDKSRLLTGLSLCKMKRGRAYRAGGEYRTLTDASIRQRKYDHNGDSL